MNDVQEIRRKLWNSDERVSLNMWLFVATVTTVILGLVILVGPILTPGYKLAMFIFLFILIELPIYLFWAWRMISIFRHPESYWFCKANLCNPIGGRFRDTIRFTVLLEDPDGNKFAVNTHSIFQSHKGLLALALEDYINQTVTIAYNEETGMVVVIG